MAEARSSKLLVSALVVAIVAAVSIAVVVVVLRSQASNDSGSNGALGSASALEELLAAPGPSGLGSSSGLRAVIIDKASLKDAIEVARPRMENTISRLDVGAALFAIWASKKLTWDALQALPETTPLLFRKDPDAERGKRLCMSGIVENIRAEKTFAGRLLEDRTLPLIERPTGTASTSTSPGMATPFGASPLPTAAESAAASSSGSPIEALAIPDEDWSIPNDGKVFFATLEEKPDEPKPGESALSHAASMAKKELLSIEVVAVGSTRGIVDGTESRACGVLTGVTLPYSGVGTSDIPQHRIVGMFDLPENRSDRGGEAH